MSSGTYVGIDEVDMSDEEAAAAFDRVTRREMGISGEEFLRRWDAGEWTDVEMDDVPGLTDVWMMLPLVRQDTDCARPNTQ
jgi:hypothetical protein